MATDPGKSAADYQQLILGLAGHGEPSAPAETMPTAVAALVAEAGEVLRARPSAGEWSVLELIGHMLDAEMVVSTRLRWILAEETPALHGYDQDLWVEAMAYNEADPARLIESLRVLRAANVALYRSATTTQRERVGLHAERGPESFETTFRLLVGHDRFHLDQARETLRGLTAR